MTKRLSRTATCPSAGAAAAWRVLRASLCIGLLAAGANAHAQWAWRDATGGTTYSDTPPPPDIRPEAILRRPGIAPPAGTPAAADPGNGAAPARPAGTDPGNGAAKPGAPKTLAEQDADFRKRREERLKAEQKAADEAAKAQAKQTSCNEARSYVEMIQSGMRLMRPNADGTRGFVDDAGRSEEMQKAQERVSRDCQ